MRDPERLLQRPTSDFTARLLRAGAEEKPSSEAFRRTLKVAAVGTAIGASLQATTASAAVIGAKSSLAGVGGGAVASGVAGGAAGAGVAVGAAASAVAGNSVAALTAVAIAKWVGVGALGGVMAATAAHRLAPGSLSAGAVARSTSSAWVASAPPREAMQHTARRAPRAEGAGVSAGFAEGAAPIDPERVPAAAPSTAALAVDALRAPEAPANAAPPRPSQPAPAGLATPPSQARAAASQSAVQSAGTPVLAAEVAMVDRGRAALQRGDGAGALHALAGYEAAFPKQQLSPEVLFLRMEALVRVGNLSQARALAQRIVARGAAGPQAVRARELLGQAP
jgi:hypothetical protein